MQYRAALAVAALLPLASAFTITITSNCDYPVYGWNVVESYGSGEPTFTLQAGSISWSSPFQSKPGGGGPSIKLQKENSLFVNAEQTQIEYDMAGSTLFYDVSDVNGHPFSGSSLVMQTANPSCPTVNCPASEAVCSQAYQMPDDLRTLACDGGADIEVLLCGAASGSGSSSSSSSAAAPPPPPPAPTTLSTANKAPVASTTTPAPQAPSQQGGNFLEESPEGDIEVVMLTTVVSTTTTVHASKQTDAASKREAEEHLHAHLHRGHSRVMGRHAH